MKKILLSLAVLACGLASASAFAASPPASSASPPGYERTHASEAKYVDPISLTVAESGAGAESAFRAWVKKDQAPVQRPLGLSRVLFERIGLGGVHGGGMTARGPGDGDGDDDAQDNSVRRPLT